MKVVEGTSLAMLSEVVARSRGAVVWPFSTGIEVSHFYAKRRARRGLNDASAEILPVPHLENARGAPVPRSFTRLPVSQHVCAHGTASQPSDVKVLRKVNHP